MALEMKNRLDFIKFRLLDPVFRLTPGIVSEN
jgi:hypothetical protein